MNQIEAVGHHLPMARERKWGQRVKGEHPHFEHLGAWSRPAISGKPRLVGDSDHARSRAFRDVIDADEAGHLDVGGDFFEAFTSRRIPGSLVIVDESARQAP
jgi:uncharacterized ferritin-like protein (DUF455 family)